MLAAVLALTTVASADQDHTPPPPKDMDTTYCDPWYFTVGGGYAWSRDVNMKNTGSPWDASAQGYDGGLGNEAFVSLAMGKTFWDMVDLESEYQAYFPFHYTKFQESVVNTTGPRRYRFLDVQNASWLVNVRFHLPMKYEWDLHYFSVGPFGGVGIGIGANTVSNFHTVGYNAGSSTGNYTSIGSSTVEYSFAWQGNAGITMRPPKSAVSFNFAYRYYDGGTFKGPGVVMSNTSADIGNIVAVPKWKGHVRTNQFLFFIKVEV